MENISFLGIKTLILHYLKTFFKEFHFNTITALISSLIFIIILKHLSDYYSIQTENNNYINFIIPGIIMMVIMQETFSNISANIIWMKHHGTFQDILMSPISRIEIALSFLVSVLFIGLVIAFINILIILLIVEFNLYNIWRLILYISLTSLLFGCIGSLVGFLTYTWEIQQSIFSFIIAPISLLSGTFFSIESISGLWKNIFLANPFYYLINNARNSFQVNQSYNLFTDVFIILLVFIIFTITLQIFKRGYRVIY